MRHLIVLFANASLAAACLAAGIVRRIEDEALPGYANLMVELDTQDFVQLAAQDERFADLKLEMLAEAYKEDQHWEADPDIFAVATSCPRSRHPHYNTRHVSLRDWLHVRLHGAVWFAQIERLEAALLLPSIR